MPEIKPKKPERSGSLDLLRFFAVFIVFFAHYVDTFNYVYKIVPANLKWLPISCYSTLALLVFFIVSGYVVTMTSLKRNLREFTITRLSRIYPLFWISCIVAFVISRLMNHSFLPVLPFKAFLINLTIMPSIFGYEMLNPVFHTLLLEMVFYFFIGLVIGFKLWNRIMIIISMLLTYCIYAAFKQVVHVNFVILPFTAGMLFYFIYSKYASKWKLYILLLINFLCQLAMSQPLEKQFALFYKESGIVNMWVIAALIASMYLIFLLISTRKLHIKGSKLHQTLGEIAYPFYLFHIYFLCFYWFFRDKIQADLLLFLILLAITLTSYIINKLVEKPLSTLATNILNTIFNFFERSVRIKKIKPKTKIGI
ncbi:acyltransferase [Pedobacter ginsengiterrae]|uniref:acyltransferase family protein n=1 Tax=Pedobacter ginsengiterrae TaxID=871696 RepID=UPI0031D95BC3